MAEQETRPTEDTPISTETPERPWIQNLDEFLEKFRPVMRWMALVTMLTIISADVFLFSLVQAQVARQEMLSHRVERLEAMLVEAIQAKENSDKITNIENQVKGIENDVANVAEILKEEDDKGKRRRRRR